MLPAAHRIRTAADFRHTTRHGVRATRGSVVVYLVASDQPDDPVPARVGIIVNSTVGGSVQRHRAARRIRAAMRDVLTRLPQGSRLVVRALPGAATDPLLLQQVRAGVERLVDARR